MDQNEVTAIPKMIQLYFQYNSGLSYRHMAVLYVNIIAAKEKQPDVYHKYRRNMEQFALAQMEADIWMTILRSFTGRPFLSAS